MKKSRILVTPAFFRLKSLATAEFDTIFYRHAISDCACDHLRALSRRAGRSSRLPVSGAVGLLRDEDPSRSGDQLLHLPLRGIQDSHGRPQCRHSRQHPRGRPARACGGAVGRGIQPDHRRAPLRRGAEDASHRQALRRSDRGFRQVGRDGGSRPARGAGPAGCQHDRFGARQAVLGVPSSPAIETSRRARSSVAPRLDRPARAGDDRRRGPPPGLRCIEGRLAATRDVRFNRPATHP